MELTTDRCVIRPWRASDLDALVRHADNPKIAANLRDAFPSPYTRKDGEAWLAIAAAMRPASSFALEVAGEAAGGLGLHLRGDVERVSAEVGYWLGEAHWGKGVLTAALRAFSPWAMQAFALTRLYALPFAGNRASRRVLEKAGFTLEAILRKSAIKGGVVVDQALYGLVAG